MSKKLIEVDAQSFGDLMYWLDRCAEKGHLENCADLVDPWAIFDANGWRVVEPTQPAAGEPVAYEFIHRHIPGAEWERCSKERFELYQEYHRQHGGQPPVRALYADPPAAAHGDEAVRKDAERYRWARLPANGTSLWNMVGDGECGGNLDAAIDAAMRAQAGEGGE